jgi:cytochrome c oxidase cbb3-type subunit 4
VSYETFRQFADSWGLLYMLAIFLVVLALVLRPGAKKHADDAAQIPFREDR